jgi:GH24 family phage-related lysozyme (muramidase)
MKDKFLFDEGVKEIVMALTALGATAYELNYVHDQLQKRPEPIEQKVEALKILDKKTVTPKFDNTVDKLLNQYRKVVRVTLPSRPYPNQPIHQNVLVDFIKKHETFSPVPYWDHKQYSIGYGTRALPGDKKITEQEASNRLNKVIEHHKNVVISDGKKWGYNWTSKQINGLTSFRFNVGSLNELTNNGKRSNKEIASKIIEYNKASGKTLGGLVKRRQEEKQLFVSN